MKVNQLACVLVVAGASSFGLAACGADTGTVGEANGGHSGATSSDGGGSTLHGGAAGAISSGGASVAHGGSGPSGAGAAGSGGDSGASAGEGTGGASGGVANAGSGGASHVGGSAGHAGASGASNTGGSAGKGGTGGAANGGGSAGKGGTGGAANGGGSAGIGGVAGSGGNGGSGGGPIKIVSTQTIYQVWGDSAWRFDPSKTIQVVPVNLQAGDAILVVGIYWISSGPNAAPSDSVGTLLAAVNQAPKYGGPPVAAQLYYQLNAAPGTHNITPPNLAYGGDGTLYVLQVRGLTKLIATGSSHTPDNSAPGIPDVTVSLASAAAQGDFVIAMGGEDDAVIFPQGAAVTDPPAGWQSIGVQNDSTHNVPSEACYRLAPSAGIQTVKWSWADDTANVTAAAIAAFR